MVPMTFIWWIYHFWARFWPYFNFVDFRAYFGPFSLVNRVQFSNADAGAWNSFLRLGIIFYGKLMHKDTKFCYLSFDISTFGFKAPPYWRLDSNAQGCLSLVSSRRVSSQVTWEGAINKCDQIKSTLCLVCFCAINALDLANISRLLRLLGSFVCCTKKVKSHDYPEKIQK